MKPFYNRRIYGETIGKPSWKDIDLTLHNEKKKNRQVRRFDNSNIERNEISRVDYNGTTYYHGAKARKQFAR